ncbi:MAG: hypothetical protein AB3A66_29975 (plasmid) [Nodularia sp. CChRGM 3473]
MTTTIHKVVAINEIVLLVFYNAPRCWQFRLILPDSAIIDQQRLFCSPEFAEEAALYWIQQNRLL